MNEDERTYGYRVEYLRFWRFDDAASRYPAPPTERMNALFDDGWRLVSIAPTAAPDGRAACVFVHDRPYH